MNKKTLLNRAWIAALIAAAGCTAADDPGQVLTGRVDAAQGAVAIRAVVGDEVATAAQVRSDGSFTLSLPAGERYRLEVLTRRGVKQLVARDGAKLVGVTFKVCAPVDPFDMGPMGGDTPDQPPPCAPTDPNCGGGAGDPGNPGDPWPGDPWPGCEDPTAPNCEPPPWPGCEDPTAPNCEPPPWPGCEDPTAPNCEPPPPPCAPTDPNCGGGAGDPGNPGDPWPGCEDPTAPNCEPPPPCAPTDPNCGGGSDPWPGCQDPAYPGCAPPCENPMDPGSCEDPCSDEPMSCGCLPNEPNCWGDDTPTCHAGGCEPASSVLATRVPGDFGCDGAP